MKRASAGFMMALVGMALAAPPAGAIEVTEFPIAVEASFPRDPRRTPMARCGSWPCPATR